MKRTRREAGRIKKVLQKRYQKIRRGLKKTFSKKRNQRRLFYGLSSTVIVSLLFGVWVLKAQAQKDKQELHQNIQQVEVEKQKKVEQIQTLSKGLEELQKEKAVTDTQLKEKADSEAQKQSEIDKLKADLQAKAELQAQAVQVAVAAPTVQVGGRGGGGRASITGNSYDAGQCTAYAKSRRPDLPNDLGNADTWYYRAAAEGFSVGDSPRVGSVAAARGYMHVAIVDGVNADGTILISEQNYQGPFVVSSRTAPASEFHYIY